MLRNQEEIFSAIRDRARDLDDTLSSVIEFARGYSDAGEVNLWTFGDVPGQNFSLSDVLIDARRVVRAIGSVPEARVSLATTASCNAVASGLQGLEQALEPLRQLVETLPTDHRPRQLQPDLRIVLTISQEELANVGSVASSIGSSLESLKSSIPGL